MEFNPVVRRLLACGFPADQAVRVSQNGRATHSAQTVLINASVAPRFLLSGWILLQQSLQDGLLQTLRIYMPGDLIDEAAPNANQNLIALTTTTTVLAPSEIARTSQFAAFQLADLHAKAERALTHFLRLGRFDAQQRTAHFLLEMDSRWRTAHPKDSDIAFPFRQPDIGDYLSLSPVHVNRTLMALKRAGLIEINRTRLMILDRAGLERASERRAQDLGRLQTAAITRSDLNYDGVQGR